LITWCSSIGVRLVQLVRMAKVNRLEAEAISSDNETPVTTKRRRIEKESIKDEMDFDQQKNKKDTIYAGMMTRSRSRRGRPNRVLSIA